MKVAVSIFALACVLICVLVVWVELRGPNPNYVNLGSLAVLTLTLVVLIWYAYDTNTIARATHERWVREGVLATTYDLSMPGASVGDNARTTFRLTNTSPLVVWARVDFAFKVGDTAVSAGAIYDGSERWVVFPHQTSQGWFEVSDLLRQAQSSISEARAQTTEANFKEQLTMTLSLSFTDELGVSRTLPSRPHYFDFKRWAWIPRLGERSYVRPPV